MLFLCFKAAKLEIWAVSGEIKIRKKIDESRKELIQITALSGLNNFMKSAIG